MTFEEMMKGYQSEKKLQIICKAAQLLKEKEFGEVKMTDIAQSCDIGVATVYRYFGTKSNLVVATATYLWQQESERYAKLFTGEAYTQMSGYEQIKSVLGIFGLLLQEDPGFLHFVYKMDQYVLSEKISDTDIQMYEDRVMDSYSIFEKAFCKGLKDGSIRRQVDGKRYYQMATHSLMSLAQKLLAGQVLQSDEQGDILEEVRLLQIVILNYLQ